MLNSMEQQNLVLQALKQCYYVVANRQLHVTGR